MGLKGCQDSKIGGTINRGISGGERRRVTIAIQLLADPSKLLVILTHNVVGEPAIWSYHYYETQDNQIKQVINAKRGRRNGIEKNILKKCSEPLLF